MQHAKARFKKRRMRNTAHKNFQAQLRPGWQYGSLAKDTCGYLIVTTAERILSFPNGRSVASGNPLFELRYRIKAMSFKLVPPLSVPHAELEMTNT